MSNDPLAGVPLGPDDGLTDEVTPEVDPLAGVPIGSREVLAPGEVPGRPGPRPLTPQELDDLEFGTTTPTPDELDAEFEAELARTGGEAPAEEPKPGDPVEFNAKDLHAGRQTMGLPLSAEAASTLDPKKAQQALENAVRMGIPPDVAYRELDRVSKSLRRRMVPIEELSRSRVLSEWFGDPTRAAAVSDNATDWLELRRQLMPKPLNEEFPRRLKVGVGNVRLGQIAGSASWIGRWVAGTMTTAEQAEWKALREREDPNAKREEAREQLFNSNEALTHGHLDPDQAAAFAALKDEIDAAEPNELELALGSFAEQLPILGATVGGAAKGAVTFGGPPLIAAIVGVATGNVPLAVAGTAATKVGLTYGGALGSAEAIFPINFGESLAGLDGLKNDQNEPLSREAILGAALIAGMVKTGLDVASELPWLVMFPRSLRAFTATTTAGVRGRLGKLFLEQPAFIQALERFGAAYAGSVVGETITEPTQEAVDIASEAMTVGIASGDTFSQVVERTAEALATPEAMQRYKSAAKEAARATAVTGGIMGTVAAGVAGVNASLRRIERGRAEARWIDELHKTAEKLRGMADSAPAAYRDLAEGVAKEAGQEVVYAQPDQLVELLSSRGIKLSIFTPSTRAEILAASSEGRPAAIPTAEHLLYVAPLLGREGAGVEAEEGGRAASPRLDVRLTPNGATTEEERVILESMGEEFQARAEALQRQVRSIRPKAEAFFKRKRDEIMAAGRSRGDAEALAVIMREYVITFAARMNISVEQALERLPEIKFRPPPGYTVARPDLAEAPTRGRLEDLTEAIADLRAPDAARPGLLYPILDILKTSGGVAPKSMLGGELRAMGVTQRTPLVGLFRKAGLESADTLIRGEWPILQYLPVTPGTDYVDQNALLDAIRDELAGNPLELEEDILAREEHETARGQLEEALVNAEIDLTTMTDAEAAAALLEREAADLEEMFQPRRENEDGGTTYEVTRTVENPTGEDGELSVFVAEGKDDETSPEQLGFDMQGTIATKHTDTRRIARWLDSEHAKATGRAGDSAEYLLKNMATGTAVELDDGRVLAVSQARWFEGYDSNGPSIGYSVVIQLYDPTAEGVIYVPLQTVRRIVPAPPTWPAAEKPRPEPAPAMSSIPPAPAATYRRSLSTEEHEFFDSLIHATEFTKILADIPSLALVERPDGQHELTIAPQHLEGLRDYLNGVTGAEIEWRTPEIDPEPDMTWDEFVDDFVGESEGDLLDTPEEQARTETARTRAAYREKIEQFVEAQLRKSKADRAAVLKYASAAASPITPLEIADLKPGDWVWMLDGKTARLRIIQGGIVLTGDGRYRVPVHWYDPKHQLGPWVAQYIDVNEVLARAEPDYSWDTGDTGDAVPASPPETEGPEAVDGPNVLAVKRVPGSMTLWADAQYRRVFRKVPVGRFLWWAFSQPQGLTLGELALRGGYGPAEAAEYARELAGLELVTMWLGEGVATEGRQLGDYFAGLELVTITPRAYAWREEQKAIDGKAKKAEDDNQGTLFQPARKKGRSKKPPGPESDAPFRSSSPIYGGVRTRLIKTGVMRTGLTTVHTPEDVAHLTASIRKGAQESFIAVATNDDGEVLRVVKLGLGTPTATLVSPMQTLGPVLATKDAARVWFVHNHPSGDAGPSQPDAAALVKLGRLARASGLDARGMVVVSPGGEGGFIPFLPTGEAGPARVFRIPALLRDRTQDVLERRFRQVLSSEALADPRRRITSPSIAYAWYTANVPTRETGLMLLDGRHRAVGFMPLSMDEMRNLKLPLLSPTLRRLLVFGDDVNASSMVGVFDSATGNEEVATHLIEMGKLWSVKIIDAISTTGGSMIERGFKFDADDGQAPMLHEKAYQSQREQGEYVALPDSAVVFDPSAPPAVPSGENWTALRLIDGTIVYPTGGAPTHAAAVEKMGIAPELVADGGWIGDDGRYFETPYSDQPSDSQRMGEIARAAKRVAARRRLRTETRTAPQREPQLETITAVAMRSPAGELVIGRPGQVHGDLAPDVDLDDDAAAALWERLFVTSSGRVVDPEEAQRIAVAAEQTNRPAANKLHTSSLRAPLSVRTREQTESEAFKAWFGDSKVLDENGRPLVATHYTTAEFEAFSHEEATRARREGSGYTTQLGADYVFPRTGFFFFLGEAPPPVGERRAVSAYLSLQNPLDLRESLTPEDTSKVIDWLQENLDSDPSQGQAGFRVRGDTVGGLRRARRDGITPEQLWALLAANGFYSRGHTWDSLLELLGRDGLIMEVNSSGTSTLEPLRGRADGRTYLAAVALNPTQIKSVENVGTFDPNDPLILYQPPRDDDVIQGSIGADKARLIALLGATMYEKPIAQVAIKELLQNAFDAVKAAVHQGRITIGKIDLNMDFEDRTITVTDNGVGMSVETLQRAFFTIGGTDKSTLPVDQRSGGLGLAKMAFLFGSDFIDVTTVHEGLISTVHATSEQIQTDAFQIRRARAIGEDGQALETGTVVSVKIPEFYINAVGERVDISFGLFAMDDVLEPPMIGPVEVTVTEQRQRVRALRNVKPVGVHWVPTGPKQTITFAWGTADLYIGDELAEFAKHNVLSAGLFQFRRTFVDAGWKAVPYHITLDIHPSVEATDPRYPFNNQREGFRSTIANDISAIGNYLLRISAARNMAEQTRVFTEVVVMPKVERESSRKAPRYLVQASRAASEAFERGPQDLPEAAPREMSFANLPQLINERSEAATAEFEQDVSRVMLSMVALDPGLPIYLNNTTADYHTVEGGNGPLFLAEMGSVVVDWRRAIAEKLLRYRTLNTPGEAYATGISIDKEYKGVHLGAPFRGFLLNPLAFRAQFSDGVAEGIIHALLHESVHHNNSGHGADFNAELAIIDEKMADGGGKQQFREILIELLNRHWQTFLAMRERFEDITTKPRAESLAKRGQTVPIRDEGDDAPGVDRDGAGSTPVGEGTAVGDGGPRGADGAPGEARPERARDSARDVVEAKIATPEEARAVKLEALAVEAFGITDDPTRAGFVLADGRMLDLRRNTPESVDHSEVARIGGLVDETPEDQRDGFNELALGLHSFMRSTGALRVDFPKGLVHGFGPTTDAQARAVVEAVGVVGRPVYLQRGEREESMLVDVEPVGAAARLTPALMRKFFGQPVQAAERLEQPSDISSAQRLAAKPFSVDAPTRLRNQLNQADRMGGLEGVLERMREIRVAVRNPDTGEVHAGPTGAQQERAVARGGQLVIHGQLAAEARSGLAEDGGGLVAGFYDERTRTFFTREAFAAATSASGEVYDLMRFIAPKLSDSQINRAIPALEDSGSDILEQPRREDEGSPWRSVPHGSDDALHLAAVASFGLTDVPEEAGYLMTDGTMLDFSGKREGGSPGTRAYDHRQLDAGANENLKEEFGLPEYQSAGMDAFVWRTGALRLHVPGPSRGGRGAVMAEGSGPITAAQARVLSRISRDRDGVVLDLDLGRDDAPVHLDLASHESTGDRIRNFFTGDTGADELESSSGPLGSGPGDARGSITISPDMRSMVIQFTETSDPSTAIHEIGHAYTLWLIHAARQDDAPAWMILDAETLLKYAGIEGVDVFAGEFTVEQKELLAETFVAYFRSGKAPSEELRGAFSRFRDWLVEWYQSVRQLIGRDAIPDDVRLVFDRMLATDEAIARAEAEEIGGSIFASIDLDAEERAAIEAAMRLSRAGTVEPIDRLQLLEVARRRGLFDKAVKERERRRAALRLAIREQVEDEINKDQAWRADHFLRYGKFLGRQTPEGTPALKIDRAAILRLFGEGSEAGQAILSVPTGARSWLSATKGVHPDLVAEQLGYDTGADLVRALLAIGSKEAGSRQRVIDEITEQRLESMGAPSPGELEEAVLRSLRNDARIDFLILEDRILSARTGAAPMKDLAERAAIIIAKKEVRELRPDVHREVARKSRREALLAVRRRDYTAAQVHLRREALHELLERQSRNAKQEVAKVLRRTRTYERSRKVRQEIGLAGNGYLETMDGILEAVDLRVLPITEAMRRHESFTEWLAQREVTGDSIIVPDWLIEYRRKNWRSLTVTEFMGLGAVLDSIANAARQERTMQIGEETVARSLVRAGLTREFKAGVLRKATRSARLTPVRATVSSILKALYHADAEELGDLLWAGFRQIDAELTGKEALIAAIVGSDVTSWSFKALIEPFARAQAKHADFMRAAVNPVRKLVDDFIREHGHGRYDEVLDEQRLLWAKPGETRRPMQLTLRDLLGIALNIGNKGNLEKLVGGFGWDEVGELDARILVMDVLNDWLTDPDWLLVNEVWAILQAKWPLIRDHERRRSGVAPPEIEPIRFLTRSGIAMTGGYFPVVYDPSRSDAAALREAAEVLKLRPTGAGKIETSHPFTKRRTGLRSRALKIDAFGVLLDHLEDVSLDLAFREPIVSTYKLLQDRDLSDTLRLELGHEFDVTQFWLPWLQAMAGDTRNVGGLRGVEKLLRGARMRASAYVMLARATTVMVQATGVLNGWQMVAEQVEGHTVGRGVRHAIALKYILDGWMQTFGGIPVVSSRRFAQKIMAKSGEIRHRPDSYDREIRDLSREIAGRYGWDDRTIRFFRHLISGAQLYFADLPTWHASYRLAIDQGKSETDAIEQANSTVRLSQGSGNLVSQAKLLVSDGEAGKLFTFLGTYLSSQLNQVRGSWRRHHSIPATAAAATIAVATPAILSMLMRQLINATMNEMFPGSAAEPPEDDEAWASKVLEELIGSFASLLPGLKDFYRTILFGEKMQAPGHLRVWADAFGNVRRGAQEAVKDDEWNKLLWSTLGAAALGKGLPGDWPLETAERAIEGEDEPSVGRATGSRGNARNRAGRGGR